MRLTITKVRGGRERFRRWSLEVAADAAADDVARSVYSAFRARGGVGQDVEVVLDPDFSGGIFGPGGLQLAIVQGE